MANSAIRFIVYLAVALLLFSCRSGTPPKQTSRNPADTLKMALEELDQKIASRESDPALYNRRARYLLIDHQPEKALKDINKAISISPK
ncbi:MAG TPA: hypothetical protein VMC08_02600, partial [Bacteroidales bacterium]|nr:hypothetical protein [Bacteroidales bacterium]